MLDADLKSQLKEYLQLMEDQVLVKISAESDKVSKEMFTLVEQLSSMSSKIKVKEASLSRTPSFSLNRLGEDTGVTFAGLPLGHEFTSLVLALLQVSGRTPKVEENIIEQIQNIEGEYNFETYISLNCQNCPEVVQALNLMSILNPGISHTMIDGAVFKDEVEKKDILAVPSVYLNGEYLESGRMSLEDILNKIGSSINNSQLNNKDPYDVLVVGGGPAGVSAAIYAARKGIRTAIVAEDFGGQVLDTSDIENFISVKQIEGSQLVSNLEDHVRDYDIDLIKSQRAKGLEKNQLIEVELENSAILKSKTAIIATGARWRKLNVPGEDKFSNKGVAYCPHCDGPMFEGKDVAVIGGGNSGIEAAIDLAGIVNHVTVLEFMPELKADKTLQKRLNSLSNVTVLTNVETKEITGDKKVDGLTYIDRDIGEINQINLEGVFVQIGLIPNTDWVEEKLELNDYGEIVVDSHGSTDVAGLFAAGDCTNSSYKQIIISMGTGATAALGAFDYLIRNE